MQLLLKSLLASIGEASTGGAPAASQADNIRHDRLYLTCSGVAEVPATPNGGSLVFVVSGLAPRASRPGETTCFAGFSWTCRFAFTLRLEQDLHPRRGSFFR